MKVRLLRPARVIVAKASEGSGEGVVIRKSAA